MEVEIILDSIINGVRVTTIRAKYPVIIHAEVLKHRNCAVSASSTRAIPALKIIAEVENNPFIPKFIGVEKPGMSPGEGLSEMEDHNARALIENLLYESVNTVRKLITLGAHKSVVNRYLMPWLEINTLTTAATPHWEHFNELRNHEAADPVMQELARLIREAYLESIPLVRRDHVPYMDKEKQCIGSYYYEYEDCLISAARCARLSYTPFGSPKMDDMKDLELSEKLLSSNHASPFEHVIFCPKEFQVMQRGDNAISKRVQTFREQLENDGLLSKRGRKR